MSGLGVAHLRSAASSAHALSSARAVTLGECRSRDRGLGSCSAGAWVSRRAASPDAHAHACAHAHCRGAGVGGTASGVDRRVGARENTGLLAKLTADGRFM